MSGKRILLVGAAGDTGIEVAAMLHEAGYDLRCTVLNETEATRLRSRIGNSHPIAQIDLADADKVGPAIDLLLENWPDMTSAIQCAGYAAFGPMAFAPISRLRSAMEINVYSSIAVFQSTLPRLARAKGRFIIISSGCGFFAMPFMGYYAASKRALESVADTLRMEAASQNVDVISIQPGRIATQMGRNLQADVAAEYDTLTEEQRTDFGYLYRGFIKSTLDGRDDGAISSPRQIAAGIVAALEDPAPRPRYRLGDDADSLWEARQTLDDRAFDALMLQAFAS